MLDTTSADRQFGSPVYVRDLHPGMGRAVAERTVLRRQPDGTYETWGDVAHRVALGNALLGERHQRPWKREAADLEHHVAKATLLMSGRHLQHGDENQPNRNMEVFTNCGHRDTRFLTIEHGVAALGDLVGKMVTVRCADGEWRPASVNQHGEQQLYRLTFQRVGPGSRTTREEIFTRNHRWLLADGRVTDDIQIGDELIGLRATEDFDPVAVQHGLVFGDGSGHKSRKDYHGAIASQGREYFSLRLCGDKREHLALFDQEAVTYPPHANGDPVVYLGKRAFWKDMPFSIDPSYIAGFIHGWWLADGSKTEAAGTVCISTSDEMAADWLAMHAPYAGLTHLSTNVKERAEGDGSYANGKNLYVVRLRKDVRWKLAAIEIEGDEPQPVFCVEEPVSRSFTLASGLVTGNCSTAPMSWLLFTLLLNGSGVGRCYDDDFIATDWDNAPNLRLVLSASHADFAWGADEDVRDARHKYVGDTVHWHEVADSREGWGKAIEVWELMAHQKIYRDHTLVLDFSKVRPRGAPIAGMQGRPSSGPKPLMHALAKVATIKGAGMKPWMQAMYIDHYLAECVLVGGARRAARMATKTWRDREVLNFVKVKRPIEYDGLSMDEVIDARAEASANKQTPPFAFLWSSNNSVTVDREFWALVERARQAVKEGRSVPREARHAWKVLNALGEAAYGDGTGEPGIINADMLRQNDDGWTGLEDGSYVGSQKYTIEDDTKLVLSRLAKIARRKEHHMITNPSLRAGTKVLTSNGIVPIEALENKSFIVKNLRGEDAPATCWLSGESEPLIRITLRGGTEYYATKQHKWPIIRGTGVTKVASSDLKAGMFLPVVQHNSLFEGGEGTADEGFLIGWNLGDGWRTERSDDGTTQLGFCAHEGDRASGIDVRLSNILAAVGWRGSLDKDEINVNNACVNRLFSEAGAGHKRDGLPARAWTGSEAFRKGLIDALFSADGSVGDKCGVVLTSSHRKLVEDVKELLGFYGIKSRIYEAISRLNGKEYPRFDLKIGQHASMAHFHAVFPLTHKAKREKLAGIIAAGVAANAQRADRVEIVAVEATDLREKVWDIAVADDTHCFQLSQCITGNCGEITLSILGGYCVIADVVPFHADTLEEAEDAFRVATRALMRTNLMDSLYQREVARTNRIGVGMTGVHEFAWKFFQVGFRDLVRPDFEALKGFTLGDSLDVRYTQHPGARAAAFWLTLARFSRACQEEARSYAEELGVVAPHTVTTIKPAGTTSKLFGLTEGWHLPAMAWYLRWVQFRHDDPLVATYKAAGYPTRELKSYSGTIIVGFPTQPTIGGLGMGEHLVTASEATPAEQYEWLKLGERFWIVGTDGNGEPLHADFEDVGNQISYTLKYDPAVVSYPDFLEMLIDHQSQIRCCSVLPVTDTSAYEYTPESQISKAEYEGMVRAINAASGVSEDIGLEHLQCGAGGCPIDFSEEAK